MMPAAILTIPSATHRTTPGMPAAVAVEAGAACSPAETVQRRQVSPRPARRPLALGARQARSTTAAARGVACGLTTPLQRERGAGEGYSEVILRLAQAITLGEP
jgi:hypothetical protein